jgi:hypothetical protein
MHTHTHAHTHKRARARAHARTHIHRNNHSMHIKNTIQQHGVRNPVSFNAKSCTFLRSRIDQYTDQLQMGRSEFDFQHGQEIFLLGATSTPIRRSRALQGVTQTANIHLPQKVEERTACFNFALSLHFALLAAAAVYFLCSSHWRMIPYISGYYLFV